MQSTVFMYRVYSSSGLCIWKSVLWYFNKVAAMAFLISSLTNLKIVQVVCALVVNARYWVSSPQARRQHSVTGGGINKFWGAREVYFVWIREGYRGTRNLSQSGWNKQGEKQTVTEIFLPKLQIQAVFPAENRWSPKKTKKKVFTEIVRDFTAEIANSSGFSGRKQVISKKKVFIHKKH